jgi:pseudaminic acid synthase
MVLVVAEISGNHLGSIENAKKLIVAAHESGADYVKLQTYKPETITLDIDSIDFRMSKDHPLWPNESLFSLYEKAQTPWEWHFELFEFAKSLNIGIFSTPFDLTAVDFLEELRSPIYKIASLETGDIPLVKHIAKKNKPIIASTGASTLQEIDLMVETIKKYNSNELTLLVCTSSYPAESKDAHLNRINFLRNRYKTSVGLSDHTLGFATSIAAVALGATVIEKHLCLGRELGGPDSGFSSNPSEFKDLVTLCKETESALGQHQWIDLPVENESRRMRRSLYIYKDVKVGDELSDINIKSIRPSKGISPMNWENVIGKKFKENFKAGTPLNFNQFD